MPEQDQGQSPTPTPTTQTPERLPADPAPSLPVPGAVQQSPLTGLKAKEGLEAREKEKSDKLRQESAERYNKRAGGKSSAPQAPPPQPKKPPQPKPGAVTPPNVLPSPPSAEVPPEATPEPPAAAPPAAASPVDAAIGMASPTMGNPTVQSMVMQLFNQSRLPGQKFHMVVLPEDDWPRVETFDTIEDLIQAIKGQLGSPCHVFPLVGQMMTITAGPNHHLRTPYGMLPLFDVPTADAVEEVEHGWLGPALQRPEAPQSFDAEVVEAAADEAEETQADLQQSLDGPPEDTDQTPIFGEPDSR